MSSGRPHRPPSYQRGRGHEPVTVAGSIRSLVAVSIARAPPRRDPGGASILRRRRAAGPERRCRIRSCAKLLTMRFHTTLLQGDKTATGIEVPAEVVEALDAGKRPPVSVTINGFTYRSTIAVMSGRYMVGVSADNRAGAGVKGGDEIDVDIELDSAPREVVVPPELASALDAEPAARRTFDALSYSNRSWHVLQVTGARTDETRERRIDKSIAALREGRAR